MKLDKDVKKDVVEAHGIWKRLTGKDVSLTVFLNLLAFNGAKDIITQQRVSSIYAEEKGSEGQTQSN